MPAIDRQRIVLLAVAAMASVAAAALAMRGVNAAAAVAKRAPPAVDTRGLAAFLGPSPGAASLAGPMRGTMLMDRDPFAPAGGPAKNPHLGSSVAPSSRRAVGSQQWIVSSILFEDSRRSAIVNNAWVTVGDPLGGGARLTAIERKHVVVTDANGNRHVVPIQGGAL
jgi:hypothetical protein